MDAEQVREFSQLLGISEEKVRAALEATSEEEHFYYNPDVFRKLHSIDCKGLRSLVVPDLSKLRI